MLPCVSSSKRHAADSNNHRPIRRRRTWCAHVLRIISQMPSSEARAKHFLIIGAWTIAARARPPMKVAGVNRPRCNRGSQRSAPPVVDWTMKPDRNRHSSKISRVLFARLRQLGANGEWKYAENFDSLVANPKMFYLDSKRRGRERSVSLGRTER